MENLIMASDAPSRYTHEDYLADQKQKEETAKKAEIKKWLQSRPEVGQLNSGKFYIYPAGGEYQEIEALS